MHYSALVLLVAMSVFIGVWFLNSYKPDSKQVFPTSSPASTTHIYQDNELKFQFEYPKDFEVISESEEKYSERTKTEYRKNFKYYVAYEPPRFVKGIIVKPKSMELTSNQFEQMPLILWVFENPDKLDSEKWYKDFWYYPFVWGVFDEPRKTSIAPILEATISGRFAKYNVVSYQPGKPKFMLLPAPPRGEPKDDKMFLFKITENGDKILSSFKLYD